MNRQILIYPLLTFFLFSFFPNIEAQWVDYPQHVRSLAAAIEGNAIWQVSQSGLLKRDLNGNILEEHIFDRFAIGSTRYYFGSATDMTIDAAGNKWIALGQTNSSYQALVRFDGTDWAVFPRRDIVGTTGSYIYNIEATPDGKLYADNYTELLQFDGTTWSIVPNNPVPSGTTRDLATSSTGEVAIAYDQHVLTYTPSAGWNIVYNPGFPQGFAYIGGVAYNAQDELHAIYYTGEVYKIANGTATLVTTSPTSLSYITDTDFSPNNELYVTSSSSSAGLKYWDGFNWMDLSAQYSAIGNGDPRFVDFDATGGVWFGSGGLKRLKNNLVEVYRDGIAGGDWNSDSGDAAGDWIFTTDGTIISRLNKVTNQSDHFTTEDFGFTNINGTAQALVGEANGNFYVSLNNGGIKYYNGSTFQSIAGAPVDVQRLDLAPDGTLYASKGYTFSFPSDGFFTYKNGSWTNYSMANSASPSDNIRDIFVDSQGRAWFASEVGLIRFENGNFTTFNTSNSTISTDEIRQVAGSTDGSTIWLMDRSFSTLQRYQNGSFTMSVTQNVGYNFNVLSADNQGNAWISLTHDGNGLGPMGAVKANTNTVEYQGDFSSRILDTWDGTVFNDNVGGVWFAGYWGAANYQGNSNLSVSLSATPVSCNGGSDGTVTASISGGTPPYEFFWYRYGYPSYFYGDEEFYYTLSVSGLPRLGMDFYVRDANGLTAGSEIAVTQPQSLSLTVSNIGNGLTAQAAGGIAPYQYAWSNGETSVSILNISDGSYGVTVTDANGCTEAATGFEGGVPTGYCLGSNFVPWNSYIRNVNVGTIDHTSGKDNGVPFYNESSTNFEKGTSEPMSVDVLLPYSSATYYVRAWIDWNRNGNYEANELVFDQSGTSSNTSGGAYTLSQNISVPGNATTGNSVMRVMLRVGTPPEVCDSGITGEVETYPVHIKDNSGSIVSLNCPADLTVSGPGSGGICQGFNLVPEPTVSSTCPQGGATYTYLGFTVISGNPNVQNIGGGSCPGIHFSGGGTAEITFAATDACGNSTTCSFIMTRNIVNSSVSFDNCPSNITAQAAQGQNSAIVSYPTLTGTVTNCPNPATIGLQSPANTASGSAFPVGQTTVSWRAYGCNQTEAVCTFEVLVEPFSGGGTCSNNILQNPSYANGSSGWSGNVQLTSDSNSAPNAVEACTPYLPIRQTLAATANSMYNLEVFAKEDAGTNGLIYIKFLTSAWSVINTEFVPITSTSYNKITKSVQAPSNAAWIEVGILKENGSGCVFADDWCLSTGGGGNPCSISATVQNVQCDNNGTATNSADDTYTFSILATGTNASSGWTATINGSTASGSYGTAKMVGPYPINSGNTSFTIADNTTASCTASATAIAPAPCSTPTGGTCSNNLLQNADFNANGTNWNANGSGISYTSGANAYQGTSVSICQTGSRIYQTVNVTAGKTYTLQVQAKRAQSARGLLVIKYLDANWTPLLQDFKGAENSVYTQESMGLAAPTGAVRAEVSFFHNGGTGCVYADDFCFSENGGGGACAITATASNITCLDNGTPNDPTDDRYEYTILVEKTGNCGNSWYDSTTGETGTYGVPKVFPSAPVTQNMINIVIGDSQNPVTAPPVLIQSPGPCSNGGGNMPDLTVENLNLASSSAQQGQVVNYNFDLKNIGNALANGNFTIKSYLSTDQTLSNDDVQDGTIPTGFVGAGQSILQTGGALTVPNSLADGQYWILLKVDADEDIAESNENNNVTVSLGQLTVGSSTTGCGFDNCISISYLDPLNLIEPITTISPNGNMGHTIGSFSSLNYEYQGWSVSPTGQIIGGGIRNYSINVGEKLFSDRASNVLIASLNANILTLKYQNVAQTSTWWEEDFTLNIPPNTTSTTFELGQMPDGTFIVTGVHQSGSTNSAVPYVLKVNNSGGGLISYTNLPTITGEFIFFMEPAAFGQSGESYLYLFNNSDRTVDIVKIDASNNILWQTDAAGDLVSTRLTGLVESSDASSLYFASYASVSFSSIKRFNASTGILDWEKSHNSIAPNPTQALQSCTPTIGLLPSHDGGVVGSFNRSIWASGLIEEAKIYKIDASGNEVWATDIDSGYRLNAATRTSDNGLVFIGEGNTNFTCAIKLTSTGSLTPSCGGIDRPDLELTASASPLMPGQWKNTSITLTLSNTGSVDATGVEVTTPASMNTSFRDKMAYVSHSASAGDYNDWFGTWNVGTVAAGTSVTLTYNGFAKVATPINYFAQVSAQSPSDADSSPNNNTSGSPTEDDEALVSINGTVPFTIGNAGKVAIDLDRPVATVFPNPASSYMALDLIDFKGKAVDLRLFDAYGRMILEKLSLTESLEYVDLEGVDSGSYMLHLRSEEARPVVLKVLVEKGM